MAPRRIEYLEMEAFERKTATYIPPWEAMLIMRLDEAFLRAVSPPKGGVLNKIVDDNGPLVIPATNAKAVGAFLRGKAVQVAHKGAKVKEDK